MSTPPFVAFDDLLAGFDWVGAAPFENSALVSRATGLVHWVSTSGALDDDDELPDDIDDGSAYVAVPSKQDLQLGKSLALDFAREAMPDASTRPATLKPRCANGRLGMALSSHRHHGRMGVDPTTAPRPGTAPPMCRNIKTLFNFDPPATELEIRDASLQFVRKLSGFNVPSRANAEAFDRAVAEVAASARVLIASLVTTAEPRLREVEAERARARSAARFGPRP